MSLIPDYDQSIQTNDELPNPFNHLRTKDVYDRLFVQCIGKRYSKDLNEIVNDINDNIAYGEPPLKKELRYKFHKFFDGNSTYDEKYKHFQLFFAYHGYKVYTMTDDNIKYYMIDVCPHV